MESSANLHLYPHYNSREVHVGSLPLRILTPLVKMGKLQQIE